jgi:hypothetical protein
MFSKDKVTEIFCTVDDFCMEFDLQIKELKQVKATEKSDIEIGPYPCPTLKF